MGKDAKPDRYVVEQRGTQTDPDSAQYYVLDVVHDFEARVALAKLANNYERAGAKVKAEEARQLLADTTEPHRLAVEAKNPKTKSSKAQRVRHA